jgi:hypothetical protein
LGWLSSRPLGVESLSIVVPPSEFGEEDAQIQRLPAGVVAYRLTRSRLFLAFLSPNYFGSPWCRREWRTWIDTEIAKHILAGGAAPSYIVEVPGLVGGGMLDEHENAGRSNETREPLLTTVPRTSSAPRSAVPHRWQPTWSNFLA